MFVIVRGNGWIEPFCLVGDKNARAFESYKDAEQYLKTEDDRIHHITYGLNTLRPYKRPKGELDGDFFSIYAEWAETPKGQYGGHCIITIGPPGPVSEGFDREKVRALAGQLFEACGIKLAKWGKNYHYLGIRLEDEPSRIIS